MKGKTEGFFGPIAQFRLERTPDKREVDGSIPSRPTIHRATREKQNKKRLALCVLGGVAQLGERLPCTQEAIGSNPFTSTTLIDYCRLWIDD